MKSTRILLQVELAARGVEEEEEEGSLYDGACVWGGGFFILRVVEVGDCIARGEF